MRVKRLSSAVAVGSRSPRNVATLSALPTSAAAAAVRTARPPVRYACTTLPRSVSGSPVPPSVSAVSAAYAGPDPKTPRGTAVPAAIPPKMASD